MFKRFYLRNMKVWSDQLWQDGLELAPVTLFLGTNSAGKTSLLQLPLLLKQTFESADRHLDLNLGGQVSDLIDLGRFEDVVHQHNTASELGLGFDCVWEQPRKSYEITYRATFGLAASVPCVQQLQLIQDGVSFGLERQSKGGYLLTAPHYTPRNVGNRPDAKRNFQPERSLMFSPEALAELGEDAGDVQDIGLRITQQMNHIAYLGPLRERPERSYMWNQQQPGDVGSRGERAVQALLSSANSRARRADNKEGGQGWLIEKVSGWLQRMGVAEELVLERQGRSRFFEVVVRGEGRSANLMDVGFGISQILPMLVLAYFVPKGTTIIAEQPEIHLHPQAQGALAELMVEVARERNVQFLVETHSEHLFRRLQLLIAKERISPAECRLYFIERHNGNATLRNLRADRYGRIDYWPESFFGDTLSDTEAQMRFMLERMKQEKRGQQ